MLTTSAIRRTFEGTFQAPAPLPLEVEVELIASARQGDRDAFATLLDTYTPGIRALAARETRRTGGMVDIDETRSNALMAFVEAVHAAREGERVAPQLDPSARQVADEYNVVGGLTVPSRTRGRYLQAVREAKNNGTDALAEAVALGMSEDTFHSTRAALRTQSYEGIQEDGAAPEAGMRPLWRDERGYSDVETRAMVATAFAAVADDEKATVVIRDYYGFSDYEPIPDAEIAHRRGLTRQTVQRKRTEGVARMRVAVVGKDA